MVGYSMGTFVIGRFLVSNPDRIGTAILGSGFFPTSDEEELKYQEFVAKDLEQHRIISIFSRNHSKINIVNYLI